MGDKRFKVGGNLTEMPEHLRFNMRRQDMPIETVWKLLNLAHYHCWDQFDTGFDHSEMEVKFEALLSNPLLVHRW